MTTIVPHPEVEPTLETIELTKRTINQYWSTVLEKSNISAKECVFTDNQRDVYNFTHFGSALLDTLQDAYQQHRPIALDPDDLFFALLQAVSLFVNQNSESVRQQIVQHEGKKQILVESNDLLPWPTVMDLFTQKARENMTSEARDKYSATFSTTNNYQKFSYDVVLMETTQNFFDFVYRTRCGIPSVRLNGTLDDWKHLKEKAIEAIRIVDQPGWREKIAEVLDQILLAFSNDAFDQKKTAEFFGSIFKYQQARGSGCDYITGWIAYFFPFQVNRYSKEVKLLTVDKMAERSVGSFQHSVASAPFIWIHMNQKMSMRVFSGQIGSRINKDGYLQVAWGQSIFKISEDN
jgi:hypothetical protein